MLDVGGRVPNQTLALAHVGSQLRNLSFGPKAGSRQPKRMEPLQPLRIGDIGLARASAPLLNQNSQPVRPATAAPPFFCDGRGLFWVRYAVDGLNDALAAATGGLTVLRVEPSVVAARDARSF